MAQVSLNIVLKNESGIGSLCKVAKFLAEVAEDERWKEKAERAGLNLKHAAEHLQIKAKS